MTYDDYLSLAAIIGIIAISMFLSLKLALYMFRGRSK